MVGTLASGAYSAPCAKSATIVLVDEALPRNAWRDTDVLRGRGYRNHDNLLHVLLHEALLRDDRRRPGTASSCVPWNSSVANCSTPVWMLSRGMTAATWTSSS